jgi:hypothetical protein
MWTRIRQNAFVWMIGLLTLDLAGCTTRSRARLETEKAFEAGQRQALENTMTRASSITVIGQVRNRNVPWKEGMTLMDAIDQAVYTGFSDPRLIRLTRGQESRDILPKDLLRGTNNPAVEVGDIIELRR